MRTYVDDLGTSVEIPVQPQRIVSLRGEQFTAPLWELGAPIVGSSGRTDDVINNGEPYVRGAFDLFNLTFENSGITWIGSPNNPDFEAIVALQPDLILIPHWQEDIQDQLSQIAPTVVIAIQPNPMLERYRKVADVAGMLDRFESFMPAYEAKLAVARNVIADTIGDPSDVSVVIAEVWKDDGGLVVFQDYAAMSQVLRDLGFAMPDFVAALEETFANISPEILPQIDADFMIGTYNFAFGEPPSQRVAEWEALIPVWDEVLHAPANNQHFFIDRETMRALSFRSLETTLAIFVSQIATRDFVPLAKAE
ncbi:putative iron compound-binding protein of ABC transporter family [Roseobacter sp. CCS2]|nr:putative iron compound-binding protein of ABC transporter family [Roseobacter sp. CCS2]